MIADSYLQLRSEVETALSGLLKLSLEMRRDPAHLATLDGLLKDIREPLLFVVVGEVKAGKSSLLNALFGQEFAKVDVLPATDRVYIFRYGDEESSVEVSPQLTERYQPIPFLKNFNVVDTPGLREVGMWGIVASELDHCFPEIRALRDGCRFADCTHRAEPECAVRDGVSAGTVDCERYESYIKLREELEESEAGQW